MYHHRKIRKNNLLQIDDNFATLVNVRSGRSVDRAQFLPGEMEFEFTYKISQIKAVQENSLSVLITIKKQNKTRHIILPATKRGDIKGNDLIENIIQHKTSIVNTGIKDKESIVLQKTSDLTSKVNNHILRVFQTGAGLETIGLKKTKLIVSKIEQKKFNEEVKNKSNTILPEFGHHSTQDLRNLEAYDPQYNGEYLRKNLLEKSIHPSSVTLLSEKSLSPHTSLKGLIRKNEYHEYTGNFLTKISNSYLFQGQGKSKDSKSEYATSVEDVFDDVITVDEKVLIQSSYSLEQNLLVKFELIQTKNFSNGLKQYTPVEVIEKTLNIQEHIKNYYTPKVAPTVLASSTTQDIVLQVKQNDPFASGIKIYKKAINHQNYDAPYVLVATERVSAANGIEKYKFTNFNDEIAIYRVIPYSIFSNKSFQEFTDVVITHPRKKGNDKLVIVPSLEEEGIKFIAYNTIKNLATVRLMMRDITLRQKDFTVTNCEFNFLNKKSSDSSILRKQRLTPNHIYEFSSKLVYLNGTEKISSQVCHVEYVPFIGNAIETEISDVNISSNDIEFRIYSKLIPDQIGLLDGLFSQTSANYDIKALKDRPADFDKLVAYNIIRYNITTGDVEDMGIFAGGTLFVDSAEGPKRNVLPINVDNEYDYLIYPLIRDPETVSANKDSVRSEIIDVETRKRHKFNPRKNHHPLTLTKGIVVSQNFIDHDKKNDMLYGKTGISYSVYASYKLKNSKISNFSAAKYDKKNVLLRWKIQDNSLTIDHIILMREIDNVRSIIGKCHALEGTESFLHNLTEHDIGHVTYLLIAVYRDFSSSQTLRSNKLVISSLE